LPCAPNSGHTSAIGWSRPIAPSATAVSAARAANGFATE